MWFLRGGPVLNPQVLPHHGVFPWLSFRYHARMNSLRLTAGVRVELDARIEMRVRHTSPAASATPGEAGGVDPSIPDADAPETPGDGARAVPGDDAQTTPSDTAPAISDDCVAAIPAATAPIVREDDAWVTPGADAPIFPEATSDANAAVIPDYGDPVTFCGACPRGGWPIF